MKKLRLGKNQKILIDIMKRADPEIGTYFYKQPELAGWDLIDVIRSIEALEKRCIVRRVGVLPRWFLINK